MYEQQSAVSESLQKSLSEEFKGAKVFEGTWDVNISKFIFDILKSASEEKDDDALYSIDLDGFRIVDSYKIDNKRRLLLIKESADFINNLIKRFQGDNNSIASGEFKGVKLELHPNNDSVRNTGNIIKFLDELNKKYTFNIDAEPNEDAGQYLNKLFSFLRKARVTVSGNFNDMELQLSVKDANFIKVVFEKAKENKQPTTSVFKGRFLTIDPNNEDTTNKNILEFISESDSGIVKPLEGEDEEDFKFKLIGKATSLGKEVVGKYDKIFYTVTLTEGKTEIKESKEKPHQSIKLPSEIQGVLDLTNIKEEDELERIELPQTVHGDIRLGNLGWVRHLTLPKIVTGDVYLHKLNMCDGMLPELPDELGGVIYFGEDIEDIELHLLKQKYPHLKDKILPKRDIEYSKESERVFEIWHKVDSGQDLSPNEIHFLYIDYFEKSDNSRRSGEVQSTHEPEQYPLDVRAYAFYTIDRRKFIDKKIKQDLATLFGCKPEEISMTEKEAMSGGKKYHYGNLTIKIGGEQQVDLPERMFRPSILSVNFSLRGAEEIKSPNILKIPVGSINEIDLGKLKDFAGVVLPAESEYEELKEFKAQYLKRATGLVLPKKVREVYLNSLESLSGVGLPEKMNTLRLNSLKEEIQRETLDKLHAGTTWLYLPANSIPSGYLEGKEYESLGSDGNLICIHGPKFD